MLEQTVMLEIFIGCIQQHLIVHLITMDSQIKSFQLNPTEIPFMTLHQVFCHLLSLYQSMVRI